MEKLRNLWASILMKLVFHTTKFRVMIIWQEPYPDAQDLEGDEPIKAIHFADSERSMNSSMRAHVESLDNPE